ncbi:type II toxin-antitoxin system VapC family toxin (plasmid) [Peteryoungia desertarenae]|uniref:Ribonuclease VapC n=1 Tax=Peteryoungia desertarenae TaxID=1813451 RepID=A0ABX6QT03_9HYPH|nr:type II toxin-antitoxin system VapC family toxin [Peteryoungia desertarenae]QLF71562.1 type II toxin-antitoxin system VapC family toxin [Peteryoungia desertarenae]
MLFIDASVAVSIITNEPDCVALMERLDREGGPYYVSAVMRLEATLSVARRLAGKDNPTTPEMFETARSLVEQFIADLEAREVPVSGDVGTKAVEAAQRFGKIINHPAKLNMGDCFSYACARAYRTKVAYKGEDFVHTDIGWPVS